MTSPNPETNSPNTEERKGGSRTRWLSLAGLATLVVGGLVVFQSTRSPDLITTVDEEALQHWNDGNMYAMQFNLERARLSWLEAVEIDPEFSLAWARLGQMYCLRGEKEDGRECMDRALARIDEVSDYERLKILSLDAGSRKDKEGQWKYDSAIVERFPKDGDAWLSLARAEMDKGHPEAGIERLRELLKHSPEYAIAYNMLGYACAEVGRWEEAEDALEKYAFVRSEEPNPHDSLAEIYEQRGRYDDAAREYRRALEADSTFTWSELHLARLLEKVGRPKDALAHLDEVTFLPSKMTEFSLAETKALILASSGRSEEALEITEQMRESAPNYSSVFYASTYAHHMAGNPEGVSEQLDLWLANELEYHGVDRDSLLEEAAFPWRVRSFLAEARGDWNTVLDLETKFREKISTVYWSAHRYSRLRTLTAYVEDESYEEGIRYAKEYLEDNPSEALALFYLASAYEGTGRVDRALTEYENVLEVLKDAEPDYALLLRTRDRIAGLQSS